MILSQGAKSTLFIRALQTLIQMYNPHIIVLLEPHISGKNADNTIERLVNRTLTGWMLMGSLDVFSCYGMTFGTLRFLTRNINSFTVWCGMKEIWISDSMQSMDTFFLVGVTYFGNNWHIFKLRVSFLRFSWETLTLLLGAQREQVDQRIEVELANNLLGGLRRRGWLILGFWARSLHGGDVLYIKGWAGPFAALSGGLPIQKHRSRIL